MNQRTSYLVDFPSLMGFTRVVLPLLFCLLSILMICLQSLKSKALMVFGGISLLVQSAMQTVLLLQPLHHLLFSSCFEHASSLPALSLLSLIHPRHSSSSLAVPHPGVVLLTSALMERTEILENCYINILSNDLSDNPDIIAVKQSMCCKANHLMLIVFRVCDPHMQKKAKKLTPSFCLSLYGLACGRLHQNYTLWQFLENLESFSSLPHYHIQ